jgi:tyrosyl-tRNA synthetase
MTLIKELENRGFIKDIIARDLFEKTLEEKQCTVYTGFDMTAPSLHVGNLVPIMNLRHFAKKGHKVIIILGGGTTKIGDPSDKNEARKLKTEEEIQNNKNSILKSLGKFFDLSSPNVQVLDNNDWLSEIKYIDFLRDIGSHFTINKMVAMDFVKRRLENQQPLSFLEFNYMLIQGYDFWHLNQKFGCTIQVGGSDQWGNILQGVELIKRKTQQEDIFAFTIPLITKSDGTKMGKSASGAVWLNKEMLKPFDYFQYFRDIADDDVIKFLKLFTNLPLEQIESYAHLKYEKLNPIKEILAFEATKICHGEETATKILNREELPEIQVVSDVNIIDFLVINTLCKSKGEAKRLLQGRGVKVNGDVVGENYNLSESVLLSIGKKKILIVKN